MHLSRGSPWPTTTATVFFSVLSACGARTSIDIFEPPSRAPTGVSVRAVDAGVQCVLPDECPEPTACVSYDCEQDRCEQIVLVRCPLSLDPCLENICEPVTGDCEIEPKTVDADGDGYTAALAGFVPGERGACGDDCDDSNANVFPGATESCDGVDNNCDGAVDENSSYVPDSFDVAIVPGSQQSSVGGMAFTGEFLSLSFSEQQDHWAASLLGLPGAPSPLSEGIALTTLNSDTFAGPVVWSGDAFGSAWEDRRHENFEIYFNRFDEAGNKLGPDLRVSNTPGFSLRPSLVWTGEEYLLAWAEQGDGDVFQVDASRIDSAGRLVGSPKLVSPVGEEGDGPALALGASGLGLVYNGVRNGSRQSFFRILDFELLPTTDAVAVGEENSTGQSVVYNAGQYIVNWHIQDVFPGNTAWAAAFSDSGETVIDARSVVSSDSFVRGSSLLPLGDRYLLVWAEESSGSYALFSSLLSTELTPLGDVQPITQADGDSTAPVLSLGPGGDVAVAYRDNRSGVFQARLLWLRCL